MHKFIFSMQTLYDVRSAAEKQARTAYAAARRAVEQAEEALQSCIDERLREEKRLRADGERGISAGDYQSRSAYIELLSERAEELREKLEQARKTAAQKQQILLDLHRDCKMLERVRENQKLEFQKEENIKESKEMDDLLMPRMAEQMRQNDAPA
jgi:flagellar FliJ protein